MVQGGMTIIRYVTFAFNFIFVICGIALIAIGAIAKNHERNVSVFLGSKFPAASILVIVAGCIVLGLAFLGCCGALKENYCMLMTFSVLLFLLFIIEIAAGITGVVFKNKIQEVIEKNMNDSLKDYGKNNNSDVTKTWDYVQKEFECCGVTGYDDWLKKTNATQLPSSCCKNENSTCTKASTDLYKKGCFKEIKEKIKKYAVQIAAAAFVIAFIQLLGMIFGCCLAHAIKKEYETV